MAGCAGGAWRCGGGGVGSLAGEGAAGGGGRLEVLDCWRRRHWVQRRDKMRDERRSGRGESIVNCGRPLRFE